METAPERKLTTILSADVAGYSPLMGADEAGTLASLRACLELLARRIAAHRPASRVRSGATPIRRYCSVGFRMPASLAAHATASGGPFHRAPDVKGKRMGPNGTADIGAIEALLRFYGEAGVDAALSEEPVDRFALSRAHAEAAARGRGAQRASAEKPARPPTPDQSADPPSRSPGSSTRPSPSLARPAGELAIPSEGAVMAAREAAASAATLDELRETLAGFAGCNLRFTATNLVFADGNSQARVMFVGEAPGLEEDLEGRPFVGRSGQLLDRMLLAIGLDRTKVYIANVIPWRPPGNRTPTPQETEICRPFIERQIALVDPDVLVPLGGASAKQLLGKAEGITKIRGTWHAYDTGRRTIQALPMLHPAGLLRQPLQKRLAWRDLLTLRAALDSHAHQEN